MTDTIKVRRQWNDWQIGSVPWSSLMDPRWDWLSGGVQVRTPQPFIHGYVLCSEVDGELAHSCLHGEGPHRIKVCLVKKDNDSATWKKLLEIVGPKPVRVPG